MIMKHALKVAVHAVIIALLSILGLVLVICLLILLPPVQHFIKEKVEAVVSKQIIGQFSFGSAQLILLNALTVRNIVIRDSVARDSVGIGYLHVRWALLPLIHKTISVKSITVKNCYIGAVRMRNGAFRLPFMPAHPAKKPVKKPAKKSAFMISLGTITIKNLEARYGDSVSNAFCDIRRFGARFRFFRPDSLKSKITAGPCFVESPWYSNRINSIELAGIFSRTRLEISNFLVTSDSIRMALRGTVPVSKTLPWDIKARIDAGLAPVTTLSRIKGLSVRQGRLWAEASVKGASASPSIAVKAQLTGIVYNRIAVDKTDLYLTHSPDGHTNGALSVITNVGHIAADAECEVPALMPKPLVRSYAASVKSEFPSLAEAAGRFGIKKTFIDGPADLDLQARGTTIAAPPDFALIDFAIRDKAGPGRQAIVQCKGRLENRQWNLLTMLDSGNSIRSQGAFGPGKRVTGSFDLVLNNIAFISRLLFSERVTGTIIGSGTIDGTFKKPIVKAVISGNTLAWRGDTVKTLRVTEGYSGKKFSLSRADIEAAGKLQNVLPRFGIDAGGTFHFIAAASSPAGQITGTAELTAEQVHYATCNAASVNGTFAYRNDTLHIDQLRIDKDTAYITLTGAAGMSRKRRFGAVSLLAQRRGFPDGRVTAAGWMAGPLIEGSVSVPSFELALIEPWIASGIPVHGTIALHGTARGTLENPSANVKLDFFQRFGREQVDWHAQAALRNLLCKLTATAYCGQVPESLMVHAVIPLSLKPPLKPARMIRDGARVNVECTDLSIGELMESFMPRIRGAGLLSVNAALVRQPADWAIRATVRSTITTLADSISGLHAYDFKTAIDASGTSRRPQFTVAITGDSLRLRGYTFANANMRVRSTETMLFIDTASAAIQTGQLTASGSIPWMRTGPKPDITGLQLRFQAHQVPLAAVSAVSPAAGITGGVLDGRAFITMKEGRPLVNGNLSLQNARIRLTDCGPEPGPINAALLFRGDSIIIESLDGHIGKSGQLTGKGYIETGKELHALVMINGSDLRQQCPDMDIGLSRMGLRFADSSGTLVLGGRITLAPSRYSLFVSPATLSKKPPPKPAAPGGGKKTVAPQERLALRTIIDLDQNLTIESNLGRVVLDGTITIVGSPSHPGIVGTVSVADGYIYYLDQKFIIQQGTFSFFNPKEINPQINLSANTQITSYGTSATTGTPTQQITYTVTVAVTGDARKPTMTLTSQPPLAPELIISLITFGTTQGAAGGEFSRKIQGFLTQQLAGFGTRPLEQLLGLETLTLETQGTSGAVVTATKRLSSRLAVTYQTTLQNLGAPTVSATYRLLPFLYLEGTGYSIHAGSIDLHFRLSR